MRELLLLLALAIQPGRAAEPPTVARVALYVQFDQTPPAAVMNSLRTELDSIMAPAGLQFEWRALADSSAEVTAELAVVSFKGRCDSTSLPPHSRNPGALGWTHISDGVILPFTDLDCGGLRAFLENNCWLWRGGIATAPWGAPSAGCWRTSYTTSSPTLRGTRRTALESPPIRWRTCSPPVSASRRGKPWRCARIKGRRLLAVIPRVADPEW